MLIFRDFPGGFREIPNLGREIIKQKMQPFPTVLCVTL